MSRHGLDQRGIVIIDAADIDAFGDGAIDEFDRALIDYFGLKAARQPAIVFVWPKHHRRWREIAIAPQPGSLASVTRIVQDSISSEVLGARQRSQRPAKARIEPSAAAK